MNAKELIAAGFVPGPNFKPMLARAYDLNALGVSPDNIVLILQMEFAEAPKLEMKSAGDLRVALIPETADEIENLRVVTSQMANMCRVPVIVSGAVMPDACPTGKESASITVGGAIKVKDAIIPAAHSADICCSMHASFFVMPSTVDIKLLIGQLRQVTRFGAGGRRVADYIDHPVIHEDVWSNPFLCGLGEYAAKHMGDQGDGNHFAYIGQMVITQALVDKLEYNRYVNLSDNFQNLIGSTVLVLVTHHGSRGLGAQVYKRGQAAALAHTKKVASGVPDSAAWIDANSTEGQSYWDALQYIARWTEANHEVIHQGFMARTGLDRVGVVKNQHNFVWKKDGFFYHGKGATPAWKVDGKPLLGLIPMNMAEPILLVLGSDNEEFLSFAPHGAGRNLSRSATIKMFPTEESRAEQLAVSTAGVHVEWYYGKPDLSESPIGYKNASQVRAQIESFGLAQTIGVIKPLGCIMAGDSGPAPWQRPKKVVNVGA